MDKMNLKKTTQRLVDVLKKYKYAALVLIIGLVLLLLPLGSSDKPAEESFAEKGESSQVTDYAKEMETRLTEMLMQIQGAGRVSVMLTLERGAKTEYHADTQISEEISGNESQTSQEQKTVILSEGSAYDKAAVSAVHYPQFKGALIISDGADNGTVKWNLVQAVSALTGLSTDRISVVKMK